MNQMSSINTLFVKSYDALVEVFAYTVAVISKSLPQSDYYSKAAKDLLPSANKLLATTQRYEGGEKLSLAETSDLLYELCTSNTALFESVEKLGLLPLIQKILSYRDLVINTRQYIE